LFTAAACKLLKLPKLEVIRPVVDDPITALALVRLVVLMVLLLTLVVLGRFLLDGRCWRWWPHNNRRIENECPVALEGLLLSILSLHSSWTSSGSSIRDCISSNCHSKASNRRSTSWHSISNNVSACVIVGLLSICSSHIDCINFCNDDVQNGMCGRRFAFGVVFAGMSLRRLRFCLVVVDVFFLWGFFVSDGIESIIAVVVSFLDSTGGNFGRTPRWNISSSWSSAEISWYGLCKVSNSKHNSPKVLRKKKEKNWRC
jgi:hypothetical protein